MRLDNFSEFTEARRSSPVIHTTFKLSPAVDIIFLIDDIRPIRPSVRLIAQALCAYFIINTTGVYLESFGNLFFIPIF